MCGIFGCIVKDKSSGSSFMEETSFAMRNRGPDDYKYYSTSIEGSAYTLFLGINRLIINDEIGGRQPFQSFDENNVLVFNGEIFGCTALRANLSEKGHQFSSRNSDTEVLFHSLVDKGLPTLATLRGMFAGAFYSKLDKKLDLFVDFPGHKNILWTFSGNALYFSSELRPLVEFSQIKTTLNPESIATYLALGFIPAPLTVYNEIQRLSGGSNLSILVSNDILEFNHGNTEFIAPEPLTSGLTSLLLDTVETWLSSDYPVSSLISGGVDSALVTSIASKFTKVESFCFGFTDDHLQSFNEIADAKSTASSLGCEFSEVVVSERQFFAELPNSLALFAEPFCGSIPSYFLFNKISQKYRVTLTGHGADELFGNYGRSCPYFNEHFNCSTYLSHIYSSDPSLASPHISRHVVTIKTSDFYKNTVCTAEFHNELSNDFLRYNDIFSMNYSVESRSPYLDQNIIKYRILYPELFISSDPASPKQKIYEIADTFLPDFVLDRPKKGLTFPFSFGVRSGKLYFDLLSSIDVMIADEIIPRSYASHVKSQVSIFLDGSNVNLDFIWRVICLSIWHNTHFS
jgi:asparagine synthase (glutamine-hydrolysing)